MTNEELRVAALLQEANMIYWEMTKTEIVSSETLEFFASIERCKNAIAVRVARKAEPSIFTNPKIPDLNFFKSKL